MALAHVVLCHRSPRYVAELVRALYHPDHPILLHADAKAPPELHETLRRLAAAFATVHVVPSGLCSWGGWSLVAATLRAIGLALALPTPWRHLLLLSEHHVPLQPPATMAACLPEGVSFSDATPFAGMGPDQRRDVLHRVTRHWRELPGVGMFATAPRTLDPTHRHALRLGSQWVVLARAACERLGSGRAAAALAPFHDSLVSDETALASVLLGQALAHGLEFRRENTTFMAWPHLGGDADSQFDDAAVRDARARGFLFIRKRPRVLPRTAAALLAAMPDRPKLPPIPPEPPPPTPSPAAVGVADAVVDALRCRVPDLVAASLRGGPDCFLRLRSASLTRDLSVYLASQDLAAFKLLLVWRRAFDGILGPIRLAGYETTVMGARLPDLALAREVHLPDVPAYGFLRPEVSGLAEAAAEALTVAARLAPLVPALAA